MDNKNVKKIRMIFFHESAKHTNAFEHPSFGKHSKLYLKLGLLYV